MKKIASLTLALIIAATGSTQAMKRRYSQASLCSSIESYCSQDTFTSNIEYAAFKLRENPTPQTLYGLLSEKVFHPEQTDDIGYGLLHFIAESDFYATDEKPLSYELIECIFACGGDLHYEGLNGKTRSPFDILLTNAQFNKHLDGEFIDKLQKIHRDYWHKETYLKTYYYAQDAFASYADDWLDQAVVAIKAAHGFWGRAPEHVKPFINLLIEDILSWNDRVLERVIHVYSQEVVLSKAPFYQKLVWPKVHRILMDEEEQRPKIDPQSRDHRHRSHKTSSR